MRRSNPSFWCKKKAWKFFGLFSWKIEKKMEGELHVDFQTDRLWKDGPSEKVEKDDGNNGRGTSWSQEHLSLTEKVHQG